MRRRRLPPKMRRLPRLRRHRHPQPGLFTPLNIGIALLVLLVLIGIIFVVIRRRGGGEEEPDERANPLRICFDRAGPDDSLRRFLLDEAVPRSFKRRLWDFCFSGASETGSPM